MDRKRNLNADEIYDQVVLIDQQAKELQCTIDQYRIYGNGEPLLNYANVMKSIERITAPDGLNMSYKELLSLQQVSPNDQETGR
ncbi:hypothetical protein CS542_03510 [Pedobacter sp. IW39]|nr:hypothetical protein CS542_03510 [Pedobacter sp. IW39]